MQNMRHIFKSCVTKILVMLCIMVSGSSGQYGGLVCFVPGSCVDSIVLDETEAASEDECLEFCQSFGSACQWFTFYGPELGFCTALASCDQRDESCSECVSGQRGCERQCFIQGFCEGNLINLLQVQDPEACLIECQRLEECNWFSFDITDNACVLSRDCLVFLEEDTNFISGEDECQSTGNSGKSGQASHSS